MSIKYKFKGNPYAAVECYETMKYLNALYEVDRLADQNSEQYKEVARSCERVQSRQIMALLEFMVGHITRLEAQIDDLVCEVDSLKTSVNDLEDDRE